jgi:N-acetylneuraminic acid mutarotase
MKRPTLLRSILPFLFAAFLTGVSRSEGPATETAGASLPPMPESVTSFGAVTHAGWLYIFGGHKGERHEYSKEMVSGSFYRLDLNDGAAWERLPEAMPGQGQPLTAHAGYIYRVGGMAARNPEGEKQDLISLALAQRFSAQSKKWEDIPALPAPRSSHDAVVLENKLYVLGGWELSGSTKTANWFAHGLVLDLANLKEGWKAIDQPFRRRALAVAALGSRIYCIGGMDSDNKTTLAVEVYDVASGQWSKGPDLPEGKNKGFACSAIAQNGRVYANAFQGDLLQLSQDGKSWEVAGRLENPRIAHRIVTAGATQIIALGGEDGEHKRPELELLTPAVTAKIPEESKSTALAR